MKALLLLGLLIVPAHAQESNIYKRYDNCVLMVSMGIVGNRYEAAERSFLACRTEEDAIRADLELTGLSGPLIDAAIATRKLRLKAVILKDPSG
jgi:hypothetical protein